MVEVKFESQHDDQNNRDKWVCPITGKELGSSIKAVYVVPCGHAFSQEAIKEMKSSECVQCNEPYNTTRDVVPILPITEADKDFVIKRIEELRELGLTHSLKKDKSSKKRKAKEAIEMDNNGTTKVAAKNGESAMKQSGIKDSTVASLTAKVLQEEEAKKKRRLLGESETIQSLYAKPSAGKKQRDADFMTRGFSIPAGAKHG